MAEWLKALRDSGMERLRVQIPVRGQKPPLLLNNNNNNNDNNNDYFLNIVIKLFFSYSAVI